MPTGVALALPDGYVALVHPRSGLAARHGLSIVNTPGTIDAGYRGEIKVLLINHDPHESVELRRGDRVAQLVVQRSNGPPSWPSTNCRRRCAAPGDTVLPEVSAPATSRPTSPRPTRKDACEVPPQGSREHRRADRRPRPRTRPTRPRPRRRPPAPARSTPRTSSTPRAGSTSARSCCCPSRDRAPAPGGRDVGQRPVGDVRRTRGSAGAAGVRRAASRRPVERGPAPDRRRPGPPGRHRHRARGPLRHRAGLPDARRAARRHAGLQPSRVIGINGTRWLLRATLLGRPAVEPETRRAVRGGADHRRGPSRRPRHARRRPADPDPAARRAPVRGADHGRPGRPTTSAGPRTARRTGTRARCDAP